MNWFEAMILGIVQGLTEFLPVSSSGHLEIGNVLFGVSGSDNLLFAVVVHAATAVSTIIVFRRDLKMIFVEFFSLPWNDTHHFVSKIFLSMIPVGLIGVFYSDQIESFFSGNLLLVGGMLLITSILLSFSHYKKSGSDSVKYWSALVIGVAQAFAVLPGISRSGATISTALILGIDREKAARFSFLMVLIPILGASILQLKDYFQAEMNPSEIPTSSLIIGFLAALMSGFFACSWMLALVKKGKLSYFAIYCAVVGLIAIISHL